MENLIKFISKFVISLVLFRMSSQADNNQPSWEHKKLWNLYPYFSQNLFPGSTA